MMTLKELRKNFLVQEIMPTAEEFTKYKYHSAVPVVIDEKTYFVILKDSIDSRIYTYLHNPNGYKVKEDIFGVIIDKGYAYIRKNGLPNILQLVLPKKWTIEDSKIKRELEVIITNVDQENDQLLHELYTRTRERNRK